jgi:hypothetical protein
VEEDASVVARDDNAVVVRSSLCIVLDYDEFVTIRGLSIWGATSIGMLAENSIPGVGEREAEE